MTTPEKNKQEWLDFAHTVDVLSASALAKSDLAEAGSEAKPRFGGLLKSHGSRVVGGLLAAACLLVIALPVSRLLDLPLSGVEQKARQSGDTLPPGIDTMRDLGDRRARSIGLQILPPKTSFAVGEPVSITLRTDKECHLLIYSIGANDQVIILDPTLSPVTGDSLLKADTPIQVPPPNAGRPEIAQSSPGIYTIGALCSSDSLEMLGTSAALLGNAARQGGASFTSYVTNLLNGTNRDQLVERKFVYEVK
jgi:hypothetical protein